jgi:hypothetical protein
VLLYTNDVGGHGTGLQHSAAHCGIVGIVVGQNLKAAVLVLDREPWNGLPVVIVEVRCT